VKTDELKQGVIVRGPLFPEPVHLLVIEAMGDAFRLTSRGIPSGLEREP